MPKSASLRDHPSVNLLFFDEISLILIDPAVNNSVGHYPNTALFNFNNPKKKSGAGEWPKLFREINDNHNG